MWNTKGRHKTPPRGWKTCPSCVTTSQRQVKHSKRLAGFTIWNFTDWYMRKNRQENKPTLLVLLISQLFQPFREGSNWPKGHANEFKEYDRVKGLLNTRPTILHLCRYVKCGSGRELPCGNLETPYMWSFVKHESIDYSNQWKKKWLAIMNSCT